MSVSLELANVRRVSRDVDDLVRELAQQIDATVDAQVGQIWKRSFSLWLQRWGQGSVSMRMRQVIPFGVLGALMPVALLTVASSVVVLATGDVASSFSSSAEKRVTAANLLTNAGALFACVTDLPAIVYVIYKASLGKEHARATYEQLKGAYHLRVDAKESLLEGIGPLSTEEVSSLRDLLCEWYMQRVQRLGIDEYYLDLDPASELGREMVAHKEMLDAMMQQVREKTTVHALSKDVSWQSFTYWRNDSLGKQIAKGVGAGLIISTWALSLFLLAQNAILCVSAPIEDLWARDVSRQVNAASDFTQLGNFFSCLTAFGAATYVGGVVGVMPAYRAVRKKTIEQIFDSHIPDLRSLSASARGAMRQVKRLLLKSEVV